MALIVDDRDDVWRGQQAKNLLLVRPYKYFVGQKNVPGGPTHAVLPQPPVRASPPAVLSPGAHSTNRPLPLQHEMGLHGEIGDGDGGNGVPVDKKTTDDGGEPKKAIQQSGETSSAGEVVEQVKADQDAVKEDHDQDMEGCRERAGKGNTEMEASTEGRGLHEVEEASIKPHDGVPEEDRRAISGTIISSAPQSVPPPAKSTSTTSALSDAIGKLGQGLAEMLAQQRKRGAHTGRGSEVANRDSAMEAGSKGASEAGKVMSSSPTSARPSDDDAGLPQQNNSETRPFGGEDKKPELAEPVRARLGVGTSDGIKSSEMEDSRGNDGDTDEAHTGSPAEEFEEGVESNNVPETEKKHQTSSPAAPSSAPGHDFPQGKGVLATAIALENDPQLECTLKTLEAVHGAYFSARNGRQGERRVVAQFLAEVRSRVLRDVRMVFSGVIPVSGVALDPRTHRLWRLAEAHGARVDSAIGPSTTHVVAARLGTAKTNAGLRMPGVFVVHVDWLMNSVWHCRREQETSFLLSGQICGGVRPPSAVPVAREASESSPTLGAHATSTRRWRNAGGTSAVGEADKRDESGSRNGSDCVVDGGRESCGEDRQPSSERQRSSKRRRDEGLGLRDDHPDGPSEHGGRGRVDSDEGVTGSVSLQSSSSGEEGDHRDHEWERAESGGSDGSRAGSCNSSVSSSNDAGSIGSDLMDLVNELNSPP